ncbi:DUF7226 domain-containing protein [Terrisporobacter sp.]
MNIPFPQANNLDLIYDLFCGFEESGMSNSMVGKKYDMAEREGAYYLNALYYIGFLEKHRVKYFLNHRGIEIKQLPDDKRIKNFAKVILDNEFIGRVYLKTKFITKRSEKKEYIAKCIQKETHLGYSTSYRRASTIIAWLDWLDNI